MDSEINERLAVLEAIVAEMKESRKEESRKLDEMIRKFDRYEGKFGGILLAAGAIFAFLKSVPYLGSIFGSK
jgi:hypothetical protein